MKDNPNQNPRLPGPQHHQGAAPTTQQRRTVGQRRREAEQKLEHHLDEARHKNEHQLADNRGPDTVGTSGGVDADDVAAIQNDDSLTPADRVDLMANQALEETESKGAGADNGEA